nr:MAG: capsid protein [Cressdnaviricota sp.]
MAPKSIYVPPRPGHNPYRQLGRGYSTRRTSLNSTRTHNRRHKKPAKPSKPSKLTQKIGPLQRDGPVSTSYFHWPTKMKKVKLPRSLIHTEAPLNYVQNSSARLDCGVGLQAVSTIANGLPGMFTKNDMISLFAQAAIANISGGGTSVQNPVTQKIHIRDIHMELLFSNATNDVVHLMIYDCVCRRDIASGAFYQPSLAWQQGATDAGVSTDWSVVGSTPFSVPGFTEFWEIEKITDVDLHTGGHHKHKTSFQPFCVINNEIVGAGGNTPAWGKLTRYSMVVVHGYPINDSTTKTQVSTASCSLDMVWKKSYQFDVLERSTTTITAVNNLLGSFTVAGVATNDLTGALATTVGVS